MRRNCKFRMNPAFAVGVTLLWAGSFVQNVLGPQGLAQNLTHMACGAAVGITFVGLLYGSPKTRPLLDRFRAFKRNLLGRGEGTSC